jgi:hypothetical protein
MNATATIAPAHASTNLAGGPPSPVGGPQYMRALQRANQVRLARAELKRRIATGELAVSDVLIDCPWEAESMAVADLLLSQRRWGQTRCRRFLAQLPMSEKKTIGSMTDRQRQTLIAMLGEACSPRALRGPAQRPSWVRPALRATPRRGPELTDSRRRA